MIQIFQNFVPYFWEGGELNPESLFVRGQSADAKEIKKIFTKEVKRILPKQKHKGR